MHEEFTPRVSLWDAVRPILAPVLIVALLGWFISGALIGWASESLRPYATWLGAVLIIVILAAVLALRLRILQKAASGSRLVVDDAGLQVSYEGTVRTLAWADITTFAPLKLPAPEATSLLSSGTGAVAVSNALAKATAPSAQGALGPGRWEDRGVTAIGRQLMSLVARDHGTAADGTPLVPVWFSEYGPQAQERLTAILTQRRPDLVN